MHTTRERGRGREKGVPGRRGPNDAEKILLPVDTTAEGQHSHWNIHMSLLE
jgi:hypothetical protein